MLLREARAVPLAVPHQLRPLEAAIEKRARVELRNTGYLELCNIDCEFADGVLTLTGQVPSYFLKQVARLAVKTLPDVLEVIDLLCVA
jgi:hypothetical protein